MSSSQCRTLALIDSNIQCSAKHQCPIHKDDIKNAYLPREQNSQNTPELAEQQKQIYNAQQCHQMQNCQDLSHSQMSSLYISESSAVSSNLSAQSLIIEFSADSISAHSSSADSTNEAVSADI